ncbi:STE family protein kinase [Tritrichomonas foetus]|uniref:non-specific serine/threonine protein kinase n=1 Tax=Tritrichomonas foetus TaxID=1144522 RepID=A0A1J4JD51_9EUKA|nr:STE family protein kinase [Tritrichomonas foetus]|eukprot:OHS96199.1 STE family protein kinase [Tritrichomonas foetus]
MGNLVQSSNFYINIMKIFHKKKKLKITNPLAVEHVLHVDNDLQWEFDPRIPSETIFRKIKEIGEGGFGTVIQLIHLPSSTLLAGKSINPELYNSKNKDLLDREVNMMRQIMSDYTIHYYGSIMFQGRMTILMEFCKLGSFRDLIDFREKVLSERQIAIVLHDLLHALQVLHEKYHIVHRDIKAANILLTADGTCRVTDFGVSRQFHDGTLTFSTQSMVGTPYWMAPEIINEEKYSYPADIWSMAATAVELAEGAPPYCEYPGTRAMVLIGTCGFPGFRFEQRFSPGFVEFVTCCANTNPSARPSIEALLLHPFIKQVETFDRMKIMEPLLKTQIDFEKLILSNRCSTTSEDEDSEEFERMTKTNILTAVKSLRH